VNYVTHDLELSSIIPALKIWKGYLLSRKLTLIIDHSGLKNVFEQLKLNTRKSKWLTMISDLYFEIKYIKGKANTYVDALCRIIQLNDLTTICSYKIKIIERVKSVGQQDEIY